MSLETVIGSFPKLTNVSVDNNVGKWVQFWITKLKDDYAEANETGSRFLQYETLDQALNPTKKDDPKHTWHGVQKVAKKDADGKSVKEGKSVVYEEIENDWPVKKFATVTSDVKRHFTFLLNRFFFEANNCYVANDNTFGTDAEVLNNVCQHSLESESPSFAALVIKVAQGRIDADAQLNDNQFSSEKYKGDNLHGYIKSRAVDYFKNNNTAPSSQIGVLVTQFLKFLKVYSILITDVLLVKREAITSKLSQVILKHLFTLTLADGVEFSAELFDRMNDFVKNYKEEKAEAAEKKKSAPKKEGKGGNKKKTTKKSKSDEDDDADEDEDEAGEDEAGEDDADADDDNDDEEEKKKPAKKPVTKKSAAKAPSPTKTKETKEVKETKETKETKAKAPAKGKKAAAEAPKKPSEQAKSTRQAKMDEADDFDAEDDA